MAVSRETFQKIRKNFLQRRKVTCCLSVFTTDSELRCLPCSEFQSVYLNDLPYKRSTASILQGTSIDTKISWQSNKNPLLNWWHRRSRRRAAATEFGTWRSISSAGVLSCCRCVRILPHLF